MSNQTNDELFERAREVVENTDNVKLKQVIADLIANNDLDGLAWVLNHAESEE